MDKEISYCSQCEYGDWVYDKKWVGPEVCYTCYAGSNRKIRTTYSKPKEEHINGDV